MSRSPRSQTDADTSTPLRKRRGTAIQKRPPVAIIVGSSEQFPSFGGAHGRIVANVRRAASVLEADVELSLPAVSVSALGRAVSSFLDEVRLGLPREGTSSTRTKGSSGTDRYGRSLQTEIRDPELAARVRKNRAAFKDEQALILKSRTRR